MALGYPNSIEDILRSKKNILLTDGASRGNPGAAGWAYILLSGEQELAHEANGHSPQDTNNRMEMTGALMGLKKTQELNLKNEIHLVTDSNFIIDALNNWRHSWKKNNWTKADKTPVLHTDLWKELDPLFDLLKPKLHHIEAHKGHPANTRCDLLAVSAATKSTVKLHTCSLTKYPEFNILSFTQMYSSPHYLCWKASEYKVCMSWPEAQNYLKANPGWICKKIYSSEEIPSIISKPK